MQPQTREESPGRARYRWAMLALVWLVYFSFGMTNNSLAPLVKTISEDLGIRPSQMGLVLGAWQLMYVVVAFAMGALVDRLGIRRSLAVGIALVTLSLALRALAVDFLSLFFIVALFGVGGPIVSIGAPKVVAVWFRGRERGMASGIYMIGPALGGITVLAATNSLVVPVLGHWRLAFVTYAAVALFATLAWWLLARDLPQDRARASSAYQEDVAVQATSAARTFAALLRLRNVRVVLLLAFAFFFMNHGLNNWLPTLLEDKGMTAATAGFMASIPGVASIAGLLVIPGMAPHGSRRLIMSLLLLGAAASTLGLVLLGGGALVGALALNGLCRRSLMPIMMLVLMETPGVGARNMGAAGGLFFSVAEIGGFSGPFVMGLLLDMTQTLYSGLVLITVMLILFSALILLISERRQEV